MPRIFRIGAFICTSIFVFSAFQNCSKLKSSGFQSLSSKNSVSDSKYGPLLSMDLEGNSQNTLAFGDGSIRSTVFGSELAISTTARLAGAIGSLTFRGKEFINQDDHGRELQSASSFDGLGECLNPTEAGSDTDGSGSISTSQLLGYSASENVLKTSTRMSYWLTANQDYSYQNNGQGCGNNSNIKKAQHSANLSEDMLLKQVKIGFANQPNVIEYLVTFRVAQSHQSAVFEALTGYLSRDFSTFWTYDPNTNQINSLSSQAGEQALPVILSTGDHNYAMGIYSPDLPQAQFSSVGYGRFNFFEYNTMKWNAVYRVIPAPAGDYNYRQYVVVGNLSEVQSAMKQLHIHFHPQQQVTPVVQPVIPAPAVVVQPVASAPAVVINPIVPAATEIILQSNFRFYNSVSGEHFVTSNYNEGVNAGFTYEGVAFRSIVQSATVSNAIQIYRCYINRSKHFVSIDSNCEGHIQEGGLGKIYSAQAAGLAPLYKFNYPLSGDYLTTTNYAEGIGAGYTYMGILGYVP